MAAEFADFPSFWAKVQETWDSQWRTVFGADWQGEAVCITRLCAACLTPCLCWFRLAGQCAS